MQAGAWIKVEPGEVVSKNRGEPRAGRMQYALPDLGWAVLELWECEVRDLQATEERIRQFMGPTSVRT